MKRCYEEKRLTYLKWKKYWDLYFTEREPVNVRPVGYFRKNKVNDCGRTRCTLCHREKYPKRKKTRQEILAELKLREDSSEM